jgi:ankyrin repeat protein
LITHSINSSKDSDSIRQFLETKSNLKKVYHTSSNNIINIPYYENGRTLLQVAISCGYGRLDIAEELLKYGVIINVLDKDIHSPLFNPALKNDYIMVKFLLDYGIDYTIRNKRDYMAKEMAIGHRDRVYGDETKMNIQKIIDLLQSYKDTFDISLSKEPG